MTVENKPIPLAKNKFRAIRIELERLQGNETFQAFKSIMKSLNLDTSNDPQKDTILDTLFAVLIKKVYDEEQKKKSNQMAISTVKYNKSNGQTYCNITNSASFSNGDLVFIRNIAKIGLEEDELEVYAQHKLTYKGLYEELLELYNSEERFWDRKEKELNYMEKQEMTEKRVKTTQEWHDLYQANKSKQVDIQKRLNRRIEERKDFENKFGIPMPN